MNYKLSYVVYGDVVAQWLVCPIRGHRVVFLGKVRYSYCLSTPRAGLFKA